jgi:hypothetical protein
MHTIKDLFYLSGNIEKVLCFFEKVYEVVPISQVADWNAGAGTPFLEENN